MRLEPSTKSPQSARVPGGPGSAEPSSKAPGPAPTAHAVPAEDVQWEDVAAFLSVEVLTVSSSKRICSSGSQLLGSSPTMPGDSVDDLLQEYLAQYNHFPRNPEQLCVFAKNHGHRLHYAAARNAWNRATRAAAAPASGTARVRGQAPPVTAVTAVTDGASSSRSSQWFIPMCHWCG
eukprot:s822_g14.t1